MSISQYLLIKVLTKVTKMHTYRLKLHVIDGMQKILTRDEFSRILDTRILNLETRRVLET